MTTQRIVELVILCIEIVKLQGTKLWVFSTDHAIRRTPRSITEFPDEVQEFPYIRAFEPASIANIREIGSPVSPPATLPAKTTQTTNGVIHIEPVKVSFP